MSEDALFMGFFCFFECGRRQDAAPNDGSTRDIIIIGTRAIRTESRFANFTPN